MTRIGLLALSVIVISAFCLSNVVGGEGTATARAEPGVLMGAPQKEHWESGSAECDSGFEECSDEISQGQFVAWPFVAEHTGTVEAIFAVLDGSNYGTNTGSEIGIYANRVYHYAEIKFDDSFENSKGGCSCTWTAADFMKYESEIPPEDPGALLGTSGKVAESEIGTEQFTEFKLEHPVKVVKGVQYWLANTTFQNYPLLPGEQGHIYQKFVHERESNTEGQPWGVYSNEPSDWEEVARPLKELPSPETSKINCEECNTEGWLQEEPKGEHLTNSNREGQEEGGQTFSYASGEIEEGPPEEAPDVKTQAPSAVTQTAATLNGTVDPNGAEVTDCRFEYGPTGAYGSSTACAVAPGSGKGPVAVSAVVGGLAADKAYHYRVVASNGGGTSDGGDEAFDTLPLAPAVSTGAPSAVTQTAATFNGTVDPNGAEVTDCRFEYGPTGAYGSSTACAVAPGSGKGPVAVSAVVGGLAADKAYHYRVVASNGGGTSDGGDEAFDTLPLAPAVSTGAPSAVTQTAATLNGTVDPNGAEVTDCRFEYGPTSTYGSSVACSPAPGSGKSSVAVSSTVGGLVAGSSYYYRVVASNGGGSGVGEAQSFATQLPTTPNEQGPAGTPPASADNTPPPAPTSPAPVPDAQFVSRSLTADASGVLVAKISCPADETTCAGAVTLKTLTAVPLRTGAPSTVKPKAAVLTVARGTFTVAGGQEAAIRLRLAAPARTLLMRAHLLKARATLAAHDPAGATHTSQTVLTISTARATHKLR